MRLLREARQQLFLVQPAQRSLSSAVAGTRRRRRSPWHSSESSCGHFTTRYLVYYSVSQRSCRLTHKRRGTHQGPGPAKGGRCSSRADGGPGDRAAAAPVQHRERAWPSSGPALWYACARTRRLHACENVTSSVVCVREVCARAFAALARCDAPLLPPLLAAEHDVDRDTEIDEDPFVQECAAEEGAPGRLDQTPLASHDRAVHPPAGSPAEMSRARAAPRSTSVCCHLLCIDADTPPGGSGPGQTIAPVLSASQKRLGMLGRRPRHAPVLPALARMEGPYRLRLHATPSPLCPLTRTCIRLFS